MPRRTPIQSDFQSDTIIRITAKSVWEADNNDGEPLIPTLAELQNFTQNVQENDWVVIGIGRRYNACRSDEYQELVGDAGNIIEKLKSLEKNLKTFIESDEYSILSSMSTLDPELPVSVAIQLSKILVSIPASEREAWLEKTQAIIKEKQAEKEAKTREKKKSPPKEGKGDTTVNDSINSFYSVQPEHFQPIANYLLRTAGEPTEKRLQWLHQEWKKANEKDPNLPHPLAPIIKEWLVEQTTPLITRQHDRKRPVGILATKSAARVRDVHVESAETRIASKAPPAAQLALPSLEVKSHLPSILPLEVLEGVPLQSRPGQTSMVVRLFFENVMELKPTEHKGEFFKYLGDLTANLSLTEKIKQRDINRVVQGIRLLDQIRIPYVDPKGGPGRYRPVIAWNEPMLGANKDFKIRFSVELPPDDRGGMLVEKAIIRELGKLSAAQFNAYLAACWLFNRYGRNPQGGLIDPTMPNPDNPRNEMGVLLHPETLTPISNERGKTVKDIYHPAAVKVLERVIRTEAKAYPTLTFLELTRACYPGAQVETIPRNKYRAYKSKALQAWNKLESKGYLRICKYEYGWQILPSEKHLNLHRALRKK